MEPPSTNHPLASIKMQFGLMLRCTIPLECKARSAEQTCANAHTLSRQDLDGTHVSRPAWMPLC
jgi:hypothetical protein